MIVCLDSFGINLDNKTFTKSVYLQEPSIKVFSTFKSAIWAFFEGFTLLPMLKLILKAVRFIIKTLYSKSRTAVANSFILITSSLTLFIVENTF